MALALLSLCAKLHEHAPPKQRALAKIIHVSYQTIDVWELENCSSRKEHVARGKVSGGLCEI